jgi:hypothetical protein
MLRGPVKVVGINNIRSHPTAGIKSIGLNGTVQLGTAVAPTNATNKGIVWTLAGVGSISQTGLFTAGSVSGAAFIQAVSAENPKIKSGLYIINVIIPVTGLTLAIGPNGTDIHRRFTAKTVTKISSIIEPPNATNRAVVFTSSNPRVAKINSAGLITAGPILGSTVITATASDTTNGMKRTTMTIRVLY